MEKFFKALLAAPMLLLLGLVGFFLYKQHKKPAAPGAIIGPNGQPIAPSPLAPQPALPAPAKNPPSTSDIQQATALVNAGSKLLAGLGDLFGGSDDAP